MVLDKIILISFPLILLVNFFLVKNYNLLFFKRTKDNEFYKPQAFHFKPTPRIGGFLIFIFLTTFLIIFYHNICYYFIYCIIIFLYYHILFIFNCLMFMTL